MNLTSTIIQVAHGLSDVLRFGSQPPQGRVYAPSARLDDLRSYMTDGLTFARLKTLVRSVDSGDLASLLGLFEEMEEKDLRLHGLASTRRNALTALEHEVVSAAESQSDRVDKALADEAAAYIEETFSELEGFDEGLEHLATAIGPNIAVAELIWDGWKLDHIEPIPSHRLTMNPQNLTQLRIITEEHHDGEDLIRAGKWIIHVPHNRAGFPFRCTISQSQAFIYLTKFLALGDWAHYVEIFGMPLRWGKYHSGASEQQKREALDMLKNMGSAAWGLFSEAVEFSLVESSQRGTSPHQALLEYCDRETAIAWLGGTLTADTSGSTGTYAAASVHDQVRQDLLEDDVRRESRTIRRDLIAPLCAYRFSGRDVPLPTFRRQFREEVDRQKEGQIMVVAQQAGVPIPKDWAYERLGIPKPEDGEVTLEPSLGAFGESLNEGI